MDLKIVHQCSKNPIEPSQLNLTSANLTMSIWYITGSNPEINQVVHRMLIIKNPF